MGDFITKRFNAYKSTQVKILIMGIAYSPNFSDFGNSAGLQIAEYLEDCKFNVTIDDPIIPKEVLEKATKVSVMGFDDHDFDIIFLATAHNAYANVPGLGRFWKKGQTVIDCTGLWEIYREDFKHWEIIYIRVGEKGWLDK